MYYVYILYSEKKDLYYVGSSKNPHARLKYHNTGKKGWTKHGTPWKIVFQKEFQDKKLATQKENFIKKQKSRKFIEKLISGKYVI